MNSLGCTPTIAADGIASPAASWGFEVSASSVRNQTIGLLLYGVSGRAALPFHGGTLCLASPFLRTPALSSGGNSLPSADCSGAWSVDLDLILWSRPPLAVGSALQCQWYGRDPGFPPPDNISLSNALELTLTL